MFAEVYDAIVKEFRNTFKNVDVFDCYPDSKRISRVPAIFVEMTDFEVSESPMTGELNLETRWEARAITGPKPGAQIEARNLAGAISLLVHEKIFVENMLPAKVLRCSDENFDRQVSGYEVWMCEWVQMMRVGKMDIDSFVSR